MLDKQRECCPHQQSRNQQEKECRTSRRYLGLARCELGDLAEQPEGNGAENADRELNATKCSYSADIRNRGDPPAGKTSQSQPQHEDRDDHCYRLNVDAVNRKQRTLPHDLVQKGGKSGDKEENVKKPRIISGLRPLMLRRHIRDG